MSSSIDEPDIFTMNAQEFREHLKPTVEEAVKVSLDMGLYFSYRINGSDPALFIHEYKNGRRQLVKIDSATGKEHLVREL